MKKTAAVITVSDKGSRGERVDTSGPAICTLLKTAGYDVVYTALIPDEKEQIKEELRSCAEKWQINLVLTTGGTGFSPRDVTPEATMEVIERHTPGIPEAMRAASMQITPKGCLSRSEAGILGRTLILNLPGSEKAAKENLQAVLAPLDHGLDILLGSGSADCGESAVQKMLQKKESPSMDAWLKEAKAHPSAAKTGMYLTHNGIVRQTAKAKARGIDPAALDVSGMEFSYDQKKLEQVIQAAYQLDGVTYIRVWLNEGTLQVGDDIMYVLVGGDIRPHVIGALQYLVGRIKEECVTEREI